MRLSIIAAGLSAALIAVPALAQQAPANIPPLEDTVYAGDWVTIGGGVGVSPSYEGSDDYVFFPVPAAAGSVGGVNFQPKGTGIGADIINDPAWLPRRFIRIPGSIQKIWLSIGGLSGYTYLRGF